MVVRVGGPRSIGTGPHELHVGRLEHGLRNPDLADRSRGGLRSALVAIVGGASGLGVIVGVATSLLIGAGFFFVSLEFCAETDEVFALLPTRLATVLWFGEVLFFRGSSWRQSWLGSLR